MLPQHVRSYVLHHWRGEKQTDIMLDGVIPASGGTRHS